MCAVCLIPPVALATPVMQSIDVPALGTPPNSRTHTVAEGESLASIAKTYSLSLDSIKLANPSVSADRLEVGQNLLVLPADGMIHTAKPGDSVQKVADRYSVKTEVILEANKLEPTDKLEGGRVLFIPANVSLPEIANSGADGAADPRIYQVQAGDTLWTVSQRFGVDLSILMVDNDIKDPKSVGPGSRIRILPTKGAETVVLKSGESMSDMAARYQIDLGSLMDYNQLNSVEAAKAGARIVIPQTHAKPVQAPDGVAGQSPAASKSQVAAAALAMSELVPPGNDKGQLIANTAMKYLGSRYVFGGTAPTGFDCSGFAYFVHKNAGIPVGRTLWQQFNSGPRVAKSQLQVGDEVFFANTYMPGLSHAGIFIGDGKFVHANNERTGVVISRLDDDYWASRFVGAARIRG
ncbi:MAG: LysM peptidoglycan-binding domain-containing protein [Chloroflexota bacterium]